MDTGAAAAYRFGGQFGHGEAQRSGCDVGGLLPRHAGRNPQQLIEVEAGNAQFGQGDVADVWRIERAAQQAKPVGAIESGAHERGKRHTQSRAGRKSVYSAASGEPGSGCQS